MGNNSSWLPVGAPKKEGTTLVELNIYNIHDAHKIVGQRPDGSYTPVTLVPQTSLATCCCCVPLCWMSIPSGFAAIVTQFGAVVEGDGEDGTWSPGCHCASPLYKVDRLVSKQIITFDAPVKDCKTKDAISVTIDILLQFEIKQAKAFVYSIGPEKFDDFLRASCDECLRQMANETNVDHIYDLHGSNTKHLVEALNEKFEKYGVLVHHFTVTMVRIPQEMARDFEDKTLFEPKTAEKHMKQSFDRLRLNHAEGQRKLKEECDNARMASEQQAEVVKNQAMKETAEVVAQTSKDIQELEASRDNEVKQVLTKAELEVSKMRAQISTLERENKALTEAECARTLAEADAYARQKQTDASIEVAARLANGRKALGIAEGEVSAALAARRAQEAEMKRLDILEQVTKKGDAMIATSQENTMSMSADHVAVTQVAQQGLEALRAKLAEITATSLKKLQEVGPAQQQMR